ncbi:porin [Verrucomicrobiota bacterium]
MMKSVKILIICFVLGFAAIQTLAGPEWKINDDASMKLSVLGQVHLLLPHDTADDEDFYLRRGRFILSGQICDGVKFFVETDNDNAGRNGKASSSTDIQDAFVDIRLGKSDHWLATGLILLPFSFENKSSAASLMGIDYNAEAIKFANHFVWRDYGAELHGKFCDKLAYHVGVFDGYDSPDGNKNSDAPLRYTGHLAMNLIGDVQSGWFYSQNRLTAGGNYLSIGLGGDTQNDATLTVTEADPVAGTLETSVVDDSKAWVADIQAGLDMGCAELMLNGAYYDWDNAGFDGSTVFAEAGLIVDKVMLTGKYSLQDPESCDSTEDYTAGLHYFLKGNNVRGGVEYRWGDSNDQTLMGIQFLL